MVRMLLLLELPADTVVTYQDMQAVAIMVTAVVTVTMAGHITVVISIMAVTTAVFTIHGWALASAFYLMGIIHSTGAVILIITAMASSINIITINTQWLTLQLALR